MEFKGIIREEALFLIGMNYYGDPFKEASTWDEENAVGHLWRRFMQFLALESNPLPQRRNPEQMAEIFFETAETAGKGYYEVFVGAVVERLETIPTACVAKQLPALEYAVFTLNGEEITGDWPGRVVKEWLPGSGYQTAADYSIQWYDARFKGMDQLAASEMDVYFPVQPQPR